MTQKINDLKSILLRLHNGESPDSLQKEFNEKFQGVSAMEIALMEQELINGNHGIDYTDVMKLCNVHANLMKSSIHPQSLEDMDHEGHPIQVLKQENLAMKACIMRINRLFSALESQPDQTGILDGLKRQLGLIGQFKKHYDRKEYVIFPILEHYGHHSVPKVMWGVDDTIRDYYDQLMALMNEFSPETLETVRKSYQEFVYELEEMIVKEEAILVNLLIETFTQDDWLTIAQESQVYGYTLIAPPITWKPYRVQFDQTNTGQTDQTSTRPETQSTSNPHPIAEGSAFEKNREIYQINTPQGTLNVQWKPNNDKSPNLNQKIPFGNGHLSIEEANLILNHLPMELTFVNKDDIFQYYNHLGDQIEMIFKRNPSQIGRNVELCHPPKLLDRVRQVFDLLKSRKKDQVTMWFPRGDKFVHVVYKAVRDPHGDFMGVLEMVQDIEPYRNLDPKGSREI